MSTHTPADDRTDHTTTADAPDTYALAAELNVDARLLEDFVNWHHDPTAPIVLGWAFDHGELPRAPEHLRDDVEAWLAARPTDARAASEEELRETGLRCDVLSRLVGGGPE